MSLEELRMLLPHLMRLGCLQILQLEKRLQDQFQVRGALEKALGYKAIAESGKRFETLMPKVTLAYSFVGIHIASTK